VLSTSYHAIKLLSNHRISSTVPITVTSPTNGSNFGPAYYVAGISSPGHYTFKVATYNTTASVPLNIKFDGVKEGAIANLTILTAPAAESYSSLNLYPGSEVIDVVNTNATTIVAGTGGTFAFELEELSIAVLTT
jgi:alpha-N-arabinofuranosidase